MANLTFKQYDTYVALLCTLTDNDGPINVSGAQSIIVVLKGQNQGGTIIGACTVVNGPQGIVKYQWESGDTAVPDTYEAEWLITWPGGFPQTVPNASVNNPTVEIDTRLDGMAG